MRFALAALLTLAAVAPATAAVDLAGRANPLAHTYSIVARDPDTGEMGVAVQSHYFSVGPTVAWAEGGQTSRSGDGKGEMLIGGLVRSASPWATPKASEAGPDFAKAGRSATGMALPAQAALTEASGPTTNGASAQTERRGALAPTFVFWLMGFPPIWQRTAIVALANFKRRR